MKKLFCILFLLLSTWAMAQKIPPAPNPPKLVNDFVGILTPDQQQHLEQKLVAYDDSTSIQIAVVIVNSLQDYDPVDYATKLGREWKVGNKKTNNGVVLLISTEEGRRKVFIAPGYGLEGALPDIICKRIVEAEIIPEFKQQHFYRGINDGTDAIIKASRGEYKAPAGYNNRGNDGLSPTLIFIIILILVIIVLSGFFGGGGPRGGMMSRRGYHNGIPPVFWFPGGGSGWSGGGGSSGGGGFGGFGGGSFGGGGAGGSW